MSQDVTGLCDTCQRANVFQKQGRGGKTPIYHRAYQVVKHNTMFSSHEGIITYVM